MDQSKKNYCDACEKYSAVRFMPNVNINYSLCIDCYLETKDKMKQLILLLPDIKNQEAPLGYEFIIDRWFKNEEDGKAYVDFVFKAYGGNSA